MGISGTGGVNPNGNEVIQLNKDLPQTALNKYNMQNGSIFNESRLNEAKKYLRAFINDDKSIWNQTDKA